MKVNHIIFDLDGTLIDSSASILASFSRVFLANSLVPKKPMDSNIIGPPLMEILSHLSGITNKKKLDALAEEFKSDYDNIGYQGSRVFSGIKDMLTVLKDHEIKIYIATNKRILPTMKIIDFLNWNNFFEAVYSLDSFSPALTSKIDVLSNIIEGKGLISNEVAYVGDTEEDRHAAMANNISFFMAAWGYGEKSEGKLIDKEAVITPNDLINIFCT
jgi:phosphoglycolate phosphatase